MEEETRDFLHLLHHHHHLEYSTVQYSTVQYSTSHPIPSIPPMAPLKIHGVAPWLKRTCSRKCSSYWSISTRASTRSPNSSPSRFPTHTAHTLSHHQYQSFLLKLHVFLALVALPAVAHDCILFFRFVALCSLCIDFDCAPCSGS